MEIVKNVIVELRPLLRCCNIFLSTTELLLQDRLVITIRPDCIVVGYNQSAEKMEAKHNNRKRSYARFDSTSSGESYSDSEDETFAYNKLMDMKPYCKMVPGSLSNLKIEQKALSFRVLTEPTVPNSGNIFNEILNSNVESLTPNLNLNEQVLNLEKNVKFSLRCSNCSNTITKEDEVCFGRVLQLPSENMDMSEWFCHGPNKEHCHAEKKFASKNSNYSNFDPSPTDLFYGNCYFLMNSSNFNSNFCKFNSKRDFIYCNRCLSCLGSRKNETIKLWNSCLKFNLVENKSNVTDFNLFSYKNNGAATHANDLPLSDVIYVISQLMKESLVGVQMPTACKMILESETVKKQSLLIWVMDRVLDVLKSVETDDNLNVDASRQEIKLDRVVAAKLLYTVVEEDNISDEWKNPSVQISSVSKEMLLAATSYFAKNSNLIPESSRRASGYFVSYVFF